MSLKRKQLLMVLIIGMLIVPPVLGTITMTTSVIDFPKLVSFFPILSVLGLEYDYAIGNFSLDAVPAMSNVNWVDSSFTATETITPDDATIFGVNATIDFPATMANLDNVTWYLFDDSTHGAGGSNDYNTATPNGYTLIKIVWTESDDQWTISQGTLSQWTMQSPEDPGTDSSETSFDFCCRFDCSKITRADTTDWNATVFAWDTDTPADEASGCDSALVTMADYFQTDFIDYPPPFTWGTINSNEVNATHGTNRVEIIANTQWELGINATDFNATGESDVDIEANDIIVLDDDNVGGGDSQWIRNTFAVVTALSTWDNQAPLTTETAEQRNVYVLINTANWFDAGAGKTWNTTLYIWCQGNT